MRLLLLDLMPFDTLSRVIACRFGYHPHRQVRKVVDCDPDGEGYTWYHVWSCQHCPAEWPA